MLWLKQNNEESFWIHKASNYDKNNIVYGIECWFINVNFFFLFLFFIWFYFFYLFSSYIFFLSLRVRNPNSRIPNSVTDLDFGLYYPLLQEILLLLNIVFFRRSILFYFKYCTYFMNQFFVFWSFTRIISYFLLGGTDV